MSGTSDPKEPEVTAVAPESVPQPADALDVQEVEQLARQYWLERGSPIGTPEIDWLRAEEEVRRRQNTSAGESAAG